MIDNDELTVISGKEHQDERGVLCHFNELDLGLVKRMYIIEPAGTHVVRAWQGHKFERKWFYVIRGAFICVFVALDDFEHPSRGLVARDFLLEAESDKILSVPGGFVSGFKAVHPGSKLMVFSDRSLEESRADDFRFDKDLWYNWQK